MTICAKCKKEMKCIKTGIAIRYHITHAYMGDLFECPICGNRTVVANSSPCYDDEIRDCDIAMEE